MKIEVTVGGEEFWAHLHADIRGAEHSVLVQTLSWEGDAAGLALADALLASGARDRRVLADAYARYILSDRFLYAPANLLDADLREEARRTRGMIDRLRRNGVGVRITNPPGFLLHRIAARDHKKLALVDDRIAYLGGINFCDHNFAWHDMMLRFESKALARFLRADFDLTWDGRSQTRSATFGPVEVHLLNGRAGSGGFESLFRVLDEAEHEIHVHSPYLTFPFVEKLAEARRRGVRVHIITPERNNYQTVKDYILWKAADEGLDTWLYPERMMHLKAILVDDRVLVVGSSNFDWLSFALCQEVVAVVREPAAIRDFRARVLEPDLGRSTRFTGAVSALRGRLAEAQLRFAARLFTATARSRTRLDPGDLGAGRRTRGRPQPRVRGSR